MPQVARLRAYYGKNSQKDQDKIINTPPIPQPPDPDDCDDGSEQSWWQRFKNWANRNRYYIVGGSLLFFLLGWIFYDYYSTPGHLDPRRFHPFIPPGEELTAHKVTKKYLEIDKLFKEIKEYYGDSPEVRAKKRHPPFDVYLNWPVINSIYVIDLELVEMFNILQFGSPTDLRNWSANWILQAPEKRHNAARLCLNFITRNPGSDGERRAIEAWDLLVELYQEDLRKDAAGISKFPEDSDEEG